MICPGVSLAAAGYTAMMERFGQCVRWVFIAVGPLAYWSLAACAIVSARNDRDVFAWLWPGALTAPVSLLGAIIEPSPEWERAWLTSWTVLGAQFNGLVVGWVVWRRTRLPRRTPPSVGDAQKTDYDDEPVDIAPTVVD